MSGAVSVSVEQLRDVAAQCRSNAPKFAESQKVNVELEMKKAFEATNQQGFEELHKAAIKNSRDVFEPVTEALAETSKILEELADRTEEASKQTVSF